MGVAPAHPRDSMADYVVTPLPPEQWDAVSSASEVAADRVLELIRQPAR